MKISYVTEVMRDIQGAAIRPGIIVLPSLLLLTVKLMLLSMLMI